MNYDDSALSRKDKRRQSAAVKLFQINEMFETNKDFQYREVLRSLQSALYTLHVGDNQEFLDEITNIEETRDEGLVTLYLWEQYQIECSRREYERDVESANAEHQQMTQLVRGKLMSRLEAQRKKLNEDKALLDIANDHSLSFDSYGKGHNSSSKHNNNHTSHTNLPGSPPYSGGEGGGSGSRRSTRRRREIQGGYEDYSGLSGGESTSRYYSRRRTHNNDSHSATSEVEGSGLGGGGGGTGAGSSHGGLASDKADLEGVLFSRDLDSSTPHTRHTSKAYHGLPALKSEDAMSDIMLIRRSVDQV